jgi:hypothetical protein
VTKVSAKDLIAHVLRYDPHVHSLELFCGTIEGKDCDTCIERVSCNDRIILNLQEGLQDRYDNYKILVKVE